MLELLLAVAALGIIAAVAVPFSNSTTVRGDLASSSRTLETSLRRAYTYARAGDNNSDWGVYATSTGAVVFSGASYTGRDTGMDESGDFGLPVTLGGTLATLGAAEVVFAEGSGTPSATGTITLTASGDTKTLTLNAEGAVIAN